MTAPTIPEDLIYPVRGEDRVTFANKANTFNQRLVDEVVIQQNALGTWMNSTAVQVASDATNSSINSSSAASSEAAAQLYATDAENSANNTANSLQAVLDSQEQANALLGAGIGTTYLQDGDLYITYVEATVSNVSINVDGVLVIETI